MKIKSSTLLFLLLSIAMNAQALFDSKNTPSPESWYVLDDVVMGGRSNGQLEITEEGHARFYGKVSLENNGGFSSVRYGIPKTIVRPEHTISLRLKGDGKRYQLRVKNQRDQYYSYIIPFDTDGNWQTVAFKLKDLYPRFRGRRLNLPNFNHTTIEEIALLIGNKVPESFELTISRIELVP